MIAGEFCIPSDYDFSFYSSVHKTYSRIYFFLIDSRLLQHVVSTEYHRLLSDHAPVSLNLNIKYSRGNYSWKFDNMLLNNDKCCVYLSKQFTLFLETNDKGDVSDSVLWETMKAVIRGDIIAYQSAKNRENRAKLSEIDMNTDQLVVRLLLRK